MISTGRDCTASMASAVLPEQVGPIKSSTGKTGRVSPSFFGEGREGAITAPA